MPFCASTTGNGRTVSPIRSSPSNCIGFSIGFAQLCCSVLETFEQRLLAEVANALGDAVMDEMVDASLKTGDRATRSLVRRKACELRLRPARA
jgi:hypothetical protein